MAWHDSFFSFNWAFLLAIVQVALVVVVVVVVVVAVAIIIGVADANAIVPVDAWVLEDVFFKVLQLFFSQRTGFFENRLAKEEQRKRRRRDVGDVTNKCNIACASHCMLAQEEQE